jgi:hypothetical protein
MIVSTLDRVCDWSTWQLGNWLTVGKSSSIKYGHTLYANCYLSINDSILLNRIFFTKGGPG